MPSIFTKDIDTPLYKAKISVNTSIFIDGQFVDAADSQVLDVLDPCTGEMITHVASANAKDVDLAVDAAKRVLGEKWGTKCPAFERGRLLSKLADLYEQHKDELCAIEGLDTGKNLAVINQVDFPLAIQTIRYYAGWADKHAGQTIETHEAKFAYTRHEPIGIVGAITPWNFPLLLSTLKIAPALATGNAVILKPSEYTPLSMLKVAEFVQQAGFPPGSFSVLPGLGDIAGQALAEHVEIGKIAFNGTMPVGRKIMEAAARSNLKRVALETGGKSPVLVFDDANLEQAVMCSVAGAFLHSGQVCATGSRIYIQEGIYSDFLERFTDACRSLAPSQSPFADAKDGVQSPVLSQFRVDRIMDYVNSAKAAGAHVHLGGERAGDSGLHIQPTIFTDVKTDSKIMQEEIFGPVVTLTKFRTEEEALKLANDTVYGVSSVVLTQDLNRAIRVAHSIEAGQVFVNSPFAPLAQVPFGGVKQSGFGKDLGEYALHEYTNVKAVHINLGYPF